MYRLDYHALDAKLASHQDFSQKRVLLRSCLNVSVDSQGNTIDDTRLTESLPGIKLLANNSKQLIITAHLGRPTEQSAQFSFAKLAHELESRLGQPVFFAADLTEETLQRIESGADHIVFLENIRYIPEEDSKEPAEQQKLIDIFTRIADVFVNDAFADYRKSVSTYQIAKHLPAFV